MTDSEIIKELTHIAFIMERNGDIRKATIIKNAVTLIEKLTAERDQARRDCAVAEHNHATLAIDEFDVALAVNMFTKRELAQLYVKKLRELEEVTSNDKR